MGVVSGVLSPPPPSLPFASSFSLLLNLLTLDVGSRDRDRESKEGRTSIWKTCWMAFSKRPETTHVSPCRQVQFSSLTPSSPRTM